MKRNMREELNNSLFKDQWNDEKDINLFTAGSEYVAQWKCNIGHTWKQQISRRCNSNNTSCPFCSNRKVWSGFNDVKTLFPELIEEWNDEKDPSTVLANGAYKAQWKCKNFGHEWKTTIYNRVVDKNNCPYCSNRKILKGFNDLATRYPKIAEEWDYEKNVISPNSVIAGSDKKIWWLCSKGHSYQASLKHRTRRNVGCPICSGRKILTGFNDLKSQRPELMKDWDFNNNSLNPEETSIHRNEKAWWICSVCHHEWKALISNRSRGFGCPQCSGAVSKQEKSLLTFIQSHIAKDIVIVENDKTIIKPKEIDIYIPDMKIGFEYNGIYWHDKQRYIHDEENSPEYQKTLLCREGGVTLLHVWSDDWLHNTSRTQQEILEFLANNRYNS